MKTQVDIVLGMLVIMIVGREINRNSLDAMRSNITAVVVTSYDTDMTRMLHVASVDMEWKWLRGNQFESFKNAGYMDSTMRNVAKAHGTIKYTAFLHHDCKPLDKVDSDSTEDYDAFMNTEYKGLCCV